MYIPSAPVQFAAGLSLILLYSVIFVLLALPHKHRVCAVLFPRLPYSLLHGCVYFALFSIFLLCLFCLTNIVFVQCSPFDSRSLLHAFFVSNIFLFRALCLTNIWLVQCFSVRLLPSLHPFVFLCFIQFAFLIRALPNKLRFLQWFFPGSSRICKLYFLLCIIQF